MTQISLTELSQKKGKPFGKIGATCRLARENIPCLEWAWIYTCCIDKTSSAELTEAISSMFAWYSKFVVCYVYLLDLESNPTQDDLSDRLARCRWFTRGWTLQELIASDCIEFFSADWVLQGTKMSLIKELGEITRIDEVLLCHIGVLPGVSVAQRMSWAQWAANRKTTRIEDMAYCLLGIFNVQMPLWYGEGERAFIRLEEILRETNDFSLFAWKVDSSEVKFQSYWGILASYPKFFADCSDIERRGDPMYNNECVWTSKGLRMTPVPGGGLSFGDRPHYLLNLQCHRRGSNDLLRIYLDQHGCDIYVRVHADTLRSDRGLSIRRGRVMYILKTVSQLDSWLLAESHKNAVDFSKLIHTLRSLQTGSLY